MKKFHPGLASALCGSLLVAGTSWASSEKTLGTITVTADMQGEDERRESVAQKLIVSRTEIEAMGALTIGDVMGKLPGIDAGTQGADGSMALRSRGMVRDSVQILVDGERVQPTRASPRGLSDACPPPNCCEWRSSVAPRRKSAAARRFP